MAKRKSVKSDHASSSTSSKKSNSLIGPRKLSLRFNGCIHEDHKEVKNCPRLYPLLPSSQHLNQTLSSISASCVSLNELSLYILICLQTYVSLDVYIKTTTFKPVYALSFYEPLPSPLESSSTSQQSQYFASVGSNRATIYTVFFKIGSSYHIPFLWFFSFFMDHSQHICSMIILNKNKRMYETLIQFSVCEFTTSYV